MDKLTLFVFAVTAIFSVSTGLGVGPETGEDSVLVDARDELGGISNFIADRKGRLFIGGKATDMFGKPQDPKKAKIVEQSKKVATAKPKPSIPLQQILDALPVTMIDPLGDRVVLTGSPPISKGETLELAFRGQTVLLRFEGARSTGAYFREMKSKKLGLRKMIRLPKGIKQGNAGPIAGGGIHQVNEGKPQNIKLELNLPGGPSPN